MIAKVSKGRQKQNRLNPAQLEALVGDYRSGMPIREIASKYGVNRDTVNNRARRRGLPQRYQR